MEKREEKGADPECTITNFYRMVWWNFIEHREKRTAAMYAYTCSHECAGAEACLSS